MAPDGWTMSRGPSDEPSEDRDLFEHAMRDVVRLETRSAPPPKRRPAARRKGPGGRVDHGPGAAMAPFEVTRDGERLVAHVAGVAPGQLAALGAGELPVELTVDLHGFPAAEARGALRDGLRRARRAGLRCVRVVHGRGLRSAAGPVLKEGLPGWLSEAPIASWTLAFTSAPPRLGGTGATLVLLRGRRDGADP